MLDLKLPKIDCLEVLRRIRENERTHLLPVIIRTTSDEENDWLQSIHLHADGFIRKPVDFEQFTLAIGQIGLRWLTPNGPGLTTKDPK